MISFQSCSGKSTVASLLAELGAAELRLQRAQAVDQAGTGEIGIDRDRNLRYPRLGDRAGVVLHFLDA